MSNIINKRYDFLYLFDVTDGNPNGDPDFANTPRFDPETYQGLVSDVCLKRKIRDYVYALKSQSGAIEPGYDIYVLQGNSLESRQRMPYDNLKELDKEAKGKNTKAESMRMARAWMCKNFFDVRTFGAVMSTTDFWCGQVRGPVQITFARSYDRIFSTDHAITRVAYTKESKKEGTSAQTEIGHKHTVAYGLYAAYGFINPNLAGGDDGTQFSEDDLQVLWTALTNMFDLDHSAARGRMAARGCYVFEHESALGNAPSHKLFDMVKVQRVEGVETPRAFTDYTVTSIDELNDRMPDGVSVLDKTAQE
ncbi:type I-C CRISPR-associated protein Cas7/Csd2 [Desulfovibrio inopinatus]|uniref:type I-C CRISPR-associated protein Cas7/Csd2 n=1 Tax=Desulfovibrio inopinatus TaxID=102109 RepID=UPI00041B7318|nr:type I-C CRISPR-associated protein Cas7/Csd2 [Desulfovibrio inopinatus]